MQPPPARLCPKTQLALMSRKMNCADDCVDAWCGGVMRAFWRCAHSCDSCHPRPSSVQVLQTTLPSICLLQSATVFWISYLCDDQLDAAAAQLQGVFRQQAIQPPPYEAAPHARDAQRPLEDAILQRQGMRCRQRAICMARRACRLVCGSSDLMQNVLPSAKTGNRCPEGAMIQR